jgi:hypothetical protein
MNNSVFLRLQKANKQFPTGQNCFGPVNEFEEQFGGGESPPSLLKPSGTSDQGYAGEDD